ncbi:hypothetical protein JXD20_00365 [Candidatus Peregrinibacteria bacterium]|nr:hypothetical protein [Candidatus Peregrinibacteria bacterium]
MISLQHALPLLIFLVVSFLAFYFVETIILFILNFLIHRHWKFVVDKLLRTIVRHRVLMRTLSLGSIAVIIILLFRYSALADLLVAGTEALRLLALILLVTMVIIYLIGSRSLTKVVIERRIHLYIFTILSLLSFAGIMTMAQSGYAAYEEAVKKTLMEPIVENIEAEYEKRIENQLIEIFTQQVKEGGCAYYDYADSTGVGLTHFVLVKEDPSLAKENPEIRVSGQPLAGNRCVHETTFLLTPEGKWYEVLMQEFK